MKRILVITLSVFVISSCQKNLGGTNTDNTILTEKEKEKEEEVYDKNSEDITVMLKQGLVAYYPFSGNAKDLSGNNNNGIVYNAYLTKDRFGKRNSAYQFLGNPDSYIDCGSSPSLQVQKNISISLWFYMDGGFYNPRMIDFQGAGNGGYMISSTGTGNSLRTTTCAYINDDGTGGGLEVESVLPGLIWSHLVFQSDETGLSKLYLNGRLINTTQGKQINFIPYDAWSLNIGRNNHPAYDAWGGYLDDIKIYNRILSEKEIVYLAKH